MEAPLVWAVVVNWNGEEFLSPCLDTLLKSDYTNLVTVVVDNASTDGSVELVRRSFPGVRLIESRENLGYAAGVNTGLEVALREGAEYVLLLNNDVEIDPCAVGALVEAALSRSNTGVVGPMIYYADAPDTIWSAGGAVSYWTGSIRHLGLRETDTGQFRDVTEVDYVTGCAMLVSRSAVEAVGLLDRSYYMYNEDTDWCVRAHGEGYAVLLAPAARLWHKVSMSSGGGLTPFKIYNRLRSTLRFFSLHARAYHWLGILPATAVRTLGFAVAQLARGNGQNVGALLRGIGDSMTGRKRA